MNQKTHVNVKTLLMAVAALLLIGFGITLYIRASVGVGAWDVLHASLAEYYPKLSIGNFSLTLSIGRWIIIVGVICVLLSQVLDRNPFYLLSIITGLVQGVFTDFWSSVFNAAHFNNIIQVNLLTKWISYFIALSALAAGIALLVRSTLPPSPIDSLMLAVIKRFRLEYNVGKFAVELLAFIAALTINIIEGSPFNNIGLGTIVSLLLIGQLVAWFDRFWVRVLRLQ